MITDNDQFNAVNAKFFAKTHTHVRTHKHKQFTLPTLLPDNYCTYLYHCVQQLYPIPFISYNLGSLNSTM